MVDRHAQAYMRMFVCLQDSKKTSTKTTFALLYNIATIFSWRVSLPYVYRGSIYTVEGQEKTKE